MDEDRSFFRRLSEKVGRFIGLTKKKDRDIVDQFVDLCRATGQKPTDVLLNFMAWFIEQGGQTIMDVGAISKQKKMGEMFAELNSMQQMAELARKAIAESFQRELELKNQVTQIAQDYSTTFAQLQQQIAELQKQLIEFRRQQDELAREKRQLELDKAQVAQAAAQLSEQAKELEKLQQQLIAQQQTQQQAQEKEPKKKGSASHS